MIDEGMENVVDGVRERRRIRFLTSRYHLLKGWCYAPAGALTLAAVVVLGVWRPEWADPTWFGLIATGVSVAATAPLAWMMNRRYRQGYGRLQSSNTTNDGPLGNPDVSAWQAIGYLLFVMWWVAMLLFYIPENTAFQDNHIALFFAGTLVGGAFLRAPDRRTQGVYAAGLLLLAGATMLPLVWANVWAVQTVCYGTLGAVALGLGLYNHRLLTQAFGPLTAEGSGDE